MDVVIGQFKFLGPRWKIENLTPYVLKVIELGLNIQQGEIFNLQGLQNEGNSFYSQKDMCETQETND